ncbi:hypothetical protein M8998_10065 [Sphingobacterium sp. lm-10]|uniref:hypothetical protein n=1 Tax=Sphingobacterium sp. lm-10 TaxID=2944904 RepID=UPI0020215D75|nr:hypothetical protein [Sphingobacterium sp. lm-10]MCL7988282.1 hypothetical protein [Sphingobacterium sp. lm-10]
MLKKILFFLAFSLPFLLAAQEDTTVLILDDLQFDVRSVKMNKDTAIVDLYVISSLRQEREFKMNTYASTLVDKKDNDVMYSQIQMGRVRIDISDRQNYLNHILTMDIPVALQFKVAGWKKENGPPQAVKIVFEDSREPGRFRQIKVQLQKS